MRNMVDNSSKSFAILQLYHLILMLLNTRIITCNHLQVHRSDRAYTGRFYRNRRNYFLTVIYCSKLENIFCLINCLLTSCVALNLITSYFCSDSILLPERERERQRDRNSSIDMNIINVCLHPKYISIFPSMLKMKKTLKSAETITSIKQ